MALEVLISTIDDGIRDIPYMLLPERADVTYLVSWQENDAQRNLGLKEYLISAEWSRRRDVRVFNMTGKGLSRNRNNALLHASGDILLFADDDCRYENEYFDEILSAYETHRDADIILFKSNLNKSYPTKEMSLKRALRHRGYYVSSVEMTMRNNDGNKSLRFNEDFGLGSGMYIAGEEDVFLKDATRQGRRIVFVPKIIVDTPTNTTGSQTNNPELIRAKRAALTYCYNKWFAEYVLMKEKLSRKIKCLINKKKIK